MFKSMLCGIAICVQLSNGIHVCPQINASNVDFDGMPLCPPLIQQRSAWSVYDCAIQQARSFHRPTLIEQHNMQLLLETWQSMITCGSTKPVVKEFMGYANNLNLQSCKVNQVLDSAPDSFLVVYVKPGITDYSGPFLLLRLTDPSKAAIIGDHDDSDGTFAATKIGFAQSHAMIAITDGHMRGNVGLPNGDFIHETDNLGTLTVKMVAKLFPQRLWYVFNGWVNPTKSLYDSRSPLQGEAFQEALLANSRVVTFGPYYVTFTVDGILNSNYYIKTEIPSVVYMTNPDIIAEIVREVETYDWAWDNATGKN